MTNSATSPSQTAQVHGCRIGASVVIPTYNRSALVVNAVKSVLAEDEASVEVIVVDDGSTDDTLSLLASQCSSPRLRRITQERRGATAARNAGATVAEEAILIFLDSDDCLLPEALRAFLEPFSDTRVAAVCAPAVSVNPTGTCTPNPIRSLGAAYEGCRGLFLAGSFAVRRDVFWAVGGFAEQCRSSQHTEFALRLLPYCTSQGLRIAELKQPTVRITLHEGTHLRGDLQALLDGALYILTRHEKQLRKSPKHYADWCAVAAVYAAKLHRLDLSRQWLRRAVQVQPSQVKHLARLVLACTPPLARLVWKPRSV